MIIMMYIAQISMHPLLSQFITITSKCIFNLKVVMTTRRKNYPALLCSKKFQLKTKFHLLEKIFRY